MDRHCQSHLPDRINLRYFLVLLSAATGCVLTNLIKPEPSGPAVLDRFLCQSWPEFLLHREFPSSLLIIKDQLHLDTSAVSIEYTVLFIPVSSSSLPALSRVCNFTFYGHGIREWFGLERALQIIWFQPLSAFSPL